MRTPELEAFWVEEGEHSKMPPSHSTIFAVSQMLYLVYPLLLATVSQEDEELSD